MSFKELGECLKPDNSMCIMRYVYIDGKRYGLEDEFKGEKLVQIKSNTSMTEFIFTTHDEENDIVNTWPLDETGGDISRV